MRKPTSKEQMCAEIQVLSRRLLLSPDLSTACLESGTPRQIEFVRDLLAGEVAHRDENKVNRLLKKAAFPCYKTFDDYETHRVIFPEGFTLDEISSGRFIDEHLNLILYGPVGTGKTHMAVAAGIAACRRGLNVRFFTVASLVRLLSLSAKNGRLDKLIRDLQKIDLLILDEWGYVPVDREGARLLFQIVADSYESKSVVITTNLEFSRWGVVLADENMAAAMIDRLVHHGHLLAFEGQSYRVEHALMRRTAAAGSAS